MTAFFNSKLFRFAFKEYFPELLGDTRELSKVFFETITVKSVDSKEDRRFEKLVDEIHKLKSSNASTKHLENEIEILLAKLYGFSGEEVILINSCEP